MHQRSIYLLGAKRPTSPVCELSAVTALLTVLRAAACQCPMMWCTDSSYALGIIQGTLAASQEVQLAREARAEATAYRRVAPLGATLDFGHTGSSPPPPTPNECADMVAAWGRKGLWLPSKIPIWMSDVEAVPFDPVVVQQISISDMLFRTEIQ